MSKEKKEWEFAAWLGTRCPYCIPRREYQITLRKFLQGYLVIVRSKAPTVEIWVG